MVIITTVEKIGKGSLFVEIDYVNRFFHIRSPQPCGKPLWKKLWRMWKSMSFQQVFRFFKNAAPGVENSQAVGQKLPPFRAGARVTSMEVSEKSRRKTKKKFESPVNLSVKTG